MSSATRVPQSVGESRQLGPATARVTSVDVLRGFDMFWIIGGEYLVLAGAAMSKNPMIETLATQFEHVDWVGFRFYDLIFPLFIFLVGTSVVFSLGRILAESGRGAAVRRVVRRSVILVLLGIFFYGGLSTAWPDIRLMGVLQRIGLCYFFAGLIYIAFHRRPAVMVAICAALLLGYWAALTWVPFPDIRLERANLERISREIGSADPAALTAAATETVRGVYQKGYNLSDYLDFRYLPGRKWDAYFDPEGILSTLPAIATCLLGVFAGLLVRSTSVTDGGKVKWLLIAGLAGLVAGYAWGLQFPVVKKIWTSSFVLVAGGYSAVLLGLVYLVVDVWRRQAWCRPFIWIGMNPITLYVISEIVDFRGLAERLAGGDLKAFLDGQVVQGLGGLVIAVLQVGLLLWLARLLYQRRIFLRV